VTPIAGKDSFIPHQIVDVSGPETVREVQDWPRNQRGDQSSGDPADSALAQQPAGSKTPSIEPQDDIDSVLNKLEQGHFEDVARRVQYLQEEIDDEEGEDPIDLESLHRFARFMLQNQLAGSPSTWIDHRGFLGLEWRIPDPAHASESAEADIKHWGRGDGILAMVFLPTGLIRFSGTSGPVGQGIERLNVSGTYTPSGALEAVQPFLSRLEIQ
jgi:hypothetical protein